MSINDILNNNGIKIDDIIILILHGSRTYGRFNENSDWDYVCVVKNEKPAESINTENIDVNILTEKEFDERIVEHDIQTLENLFCSNIILGVDILKIKCQNFMNKGIDRVKLRTSISRTASRGLSYSKNLWGQNEYNKSKKNICHAYRYTLFGLQLIESNKIYDYTCANEFADRLAQVPDEGDYKELFKQFLLECKELSKRLNALCPMMKSKNKIN